MDLENRGVGCMIGGAYGDSLGAAVEFMSLDEIRRTYGPRGITVPQPALGFPLPVITDDTQMAIATARGILEAEPDHDDQQILAHIYAQYRNWLASQQHRGERRAPGTTCLSALGSGKVGTRQTPLNRSAGCGGVMRAHPAGIAFVGFVRDPERAFTMGMDLAAITHGHPNGYVPAGALALLIAELAGGKSLLDAVRGLREMLLHSEGETLARLQQAMEAPRFGDHGATIDERVGQSVEGREYAGEPGGGWLGHDALAISLYAVLSAPEDPIEAVRIAVNHSGDSDSTGSIAGAIMGAIHGPEKFLAELRQHKIELERQAELYALGKALAEWGKSMKGVRHA